MGSLHFLIVPYSRQYDYVILLPVYIYLIARLLTRRHYLSIFMGYLVIAVIPLFTHLFFLVPLLLFITLLLLPPDGFQPLVAGYSGTNNRLWDER